MKKTITQQRDELQEQVAKLEAANTALADRPQTVIRDVCINNAPGVQSKKACMALAQMAIAAEENAKAIKALADAMRPVSNHFGTGISINQPSEG